MIKTLLLIKIRLKIINYGADENKKFKNNLTLYLTNTIKYDIIPIVKKDMCSEVR